MNAAMTSFANINLEYLETMTDGDSEMMKTMLEMLLVEIPEEFEKMDVALAAKDWNEMFQLSHKMKTTLSFIGNSTMIEINKVLEDNTRHRTDLAAVPTLLKSLTELSIHAVADLQRAADQIN
jgi:HPt (histidine-containing phosphotransfer) domain-containing protein